jgi:hypothetical protein
MGTFDPATFLDATLSDSMDTVLTPVPAGEFPGVCGEPSIREAMAKDGSQKYTFLEVPIEVDGSSQTGDGQTVKEITQRDKNTVRYSAMLEFTTNGGLDTGKGRNVGLGRLREAIGLNKKGEAFNIRMIQGRPLKVTVKHSMAEVRGVEQMVANVTAVAPL